ncbi:hypothetical protein GCM10011529_25640 [Polymorphobacter glacialis]|uniref:DUF2501 domain-containing protein n=1 Tax=Sandarakinorhabdus glacialis TaxID=1614636 RepID=A0A917EB81_9SPHN|nr:DUF2501 domain-containing protein [Polymorphobacter glacialis]GGE18006.1 hypothetical protein GCM10011529_25640 [Polymorphobacter glacialis]
MRHFLSVAAVSMSLVCGLGAAQAQLPAMPSTKSLSGLTGGLPDMSKLSAGNAAGVLGYCVKNKVLGGGDASSVLSKLTGKPGVTSSADYKTGEAGQLGTGKSALSLDSLTGSLKTKACDMVLKDAKSLI